VTPLLSALLHRLRVDRCRARFYLGGPRCRDVRGHTGKHYVFSGFATVHWF
jgi:hypothetical protein